MKKTMQSFRGLISILILASFTINAHADYYDQIEISSYHYKLFTTRGSASINLYDTNSRLVGILVFHSENGEVLPDAYKGDDGVYRLFYSTSQLRNALDMLRAEQSVELAFWVSSSGFQNSHIKPKGRLTVGGQ